jgi:hypothetical protein
MRNIFYSHDVIFIEGEPKNIEFKIENGESDSMGEDEPDEEEE